MKQLKKATHFFALLAYFAAFPLARVFAQVGGQNPGCPPDEFCNPLKFTTLEGFLVALLNVILTIAFPIIVLMIIYTGFLFVSARGNKETLERAKKSLVWTLIGAMIILGAFVLSNAIKGTIDDIRADAGMAPIVAIHY